MNLPNDRGLVTVLRSLGLRPEALLGWGGEASVYALDDDRVVRVLREGQDSGTIRRRQDLVRELSSRGAPFRLPEVLEVGEVEGRFFAVERRLPGRSVMEQLTALAGPDRDRLVEGHLEAAAALGNLHLEQRGWFGDLLADEPVRASRWRAYLRNRAASSMRSSAPAFRHIDPAVLADDLPDAAVPAFVHLDAFAGNMLAVGTTITAVLDIGATSLAGDARLDALATAVYLSSPQITPVTTPRDAEVTMSWLRSAGLADWFEPARRWLAAYWSSAVDDLRLHEWCRAVLLA
jgi:hypothetical protein